MAEENNSSENTRNSDNLLFKRLTRLLSGPLVNYKTQTGRRLRRMDLDKFASRFTSASGKQFKKTAYDPFSNLQANVMAAQQRLERYVDFDQMEYTPEIASALDIYADEMTTHSKLQPLLKVECQNEEIRTILESLYFNILNVEYNLFGWCRSMCKYGDFFLYLDIDEDRGVTSVIGLPSAEVERMEGEDKTNPNYVQFQWNSAGLTFENWQVGHFRILGNDKHYPYGTSILEAARRIWRQMTLLEDAMMAYRIVRSPERRVFYVDVGNIPPQDIEQYMQKVMTQMKRHQVVDPDTGRVDLRYNPMSIDEDYFVPVRGQNNTKIETLSGGKYTGDIEDVKYLRDKLFSALKVPQSYLARGDGAEEDKTTLAQKDIRFARTIQRLQRSVITELEKIGIVHLYVLGFREEDLINFKVSLNNPSKLAELQELEHWKTKFEVAGGATEGFFSKRWIGQHMFGLTDEDMIRMQREMFSDRQYDALLETAAEATSAAAAPSIGGGDLGGGPAPDLGGDLGGGADAGALGADAGGAPGADPLATADAPAAGGAPPTGGTDSAAPEGGLLAEPPGKRDEDSFKWTYPDNRTETSKSKGKKYLPVKYSNLPFDKRESGGARKNNRNGQTGSNISGANKHNVFKGYSNLKSISRGVMEEKDSSYLKEEEEKIFETNSDVRKIIESLNLRSKNETQT